MELKLQPHTKNLYSRGAILIKNTSPKVWLQEIQQMDLNLSSIKVYPVPSRVANELYGCLIVFEKGLKINNIGKNSYCQNIQNTLFIPEYAVVVPSLSTPEWQSLFSNQTHILHPDFGLVELIEQVNWANTIGIPEATGAKINCPLKGINIPKSITSLQIELDQDAILKQIENPLTEQEQLEKLPFDMQKLLNGNQKEMDKFIAFMDKNPELALQYAIPLDTLGTTRGGNQGKYFFGKGFGFSSVFGGIFNSSKTAKSTSSKPNSLFQFLKYPIFILIIIKLITAISEVGIAGFVSGLDIFIFILVIAIIAILFALAVSSINSKYSISGGSILLDTERFSNIRNRYEKLADDFVSKRQYEKASHVHLKLLKNNHKAASVLEEGELYPEAATVYLKYAQNKTKAAECYEKGKVYTQAIDLYKELNQDEKVGDLYVLTNNKKEAHTYFHKVINNYKTSFQYVKASLIFRNKIKDTTQAQDLLLDGWRTNKDGSNCLNNYFENIPNVNDLKTEINTIYKKETTESNKESFLKIMKHEFNKHEKLEELTKNIAYEIIAEKITQKPDIASELVHFNKNDKSITKDILKFKLNSKKKK